MINTVNNNLTVIIEFSLIVRSCENDHMQIFRKEEYKM